MFNRFMQKMYYDTVKVAKPTRTHRFIKALSDHKKLIRCYTQNIDGLERQVGLATEFDHLNNWQQLDVVQLHGDLNRLKCSRCLRKYSWEEIFVDQKGAEEDASLVIACPNCVEKYRERQHLGKRCCASSIGIIRPNIVLYGEEHPYGEILAKGLEKDISRKPKLFLIFGTSLRVVGVKRLVRKMCKTIHENDPEGRVVIINNTEVCRSSWGDYIDYQVVCDCDDWCRYVEERIPRLGAEGGKAAKKERGDESGKRKRSQVEGAKTKRVKVDMKVDVKVDVNVGIKRQLKTEMKEEMKEISREILVL
ncbi:DEKNAAC105416 [Brettanomyces naardenensis]|uniref:DEKNAAC105416 n=1 Tax=Brettanomyces naardenensis TaxID=13370 RepID=A0A448YTH7_BRENA|nr:DEKNAAC105416 [Brettanomyces naardenensis]